MTINENEIAKLVQSVLAEMSGNAPASAPAPKAAAPAGCIPKTSKVAFLTGIEKLAKEYDVLLIADEVQCGNGRTGELYGYMNFGIKPDIVSTAKGLAGGLPMGATLMGEKVKDVLGVSMPGSTLGGNPIFAAGALHIISRLDADMLNGVKQRSEYIFNELFTKFLCN